MVQLYQRYSLIGKEASRVHVHHAYRITMLTCKLYNVNVQVHREWVRGVSSGLLPPPYVPPLPAEEMHWLLQTSCDSPAPRHWQRVSVLCIRKTSESDTTRAAKRCIHV